CDAPPRMAGGASPAIRGHPTILPGQRGLEMNGCRIRIMAGALTVLFLGCTQHDSPLGVDGGDPGERAVQAELSCTVALQAGTFQCNTVSASLPAGVSGAIIGGQGVYVLLESSNVRYVDAG